jgi:hypothetical protein
MTARQELLQPPLGIDAVVEKFEGASISASFGG